MKTLFDNLDQALHFAFNYQSRHYALNPYNKLVARPSASGKGLVAMNGAAQAGLILAAIQRQDELPRACIIARYTQQTEICECCGADAMSRPYQAAIQTLTQSLPPQGRALSTAMRQFLPWIIRAFFERNISIQQLAQRFEIGKSAAYEKKNQVWSWLSEVDRDAQEKISIALDKVLSESI